MANARTIEFILKAIGDFGDVKGNIDVIQKSLNQLKLNPQLKQNFSNIFADLQKQTAKYQDYLNSGFKTKGDVTGLEKTGNKINALLNQLQTNMSKIDPSVLKESFEIDTTQFEELNNKLKETQNTINQITSSNNFKNLAGQVDGVVSKLNTLSKSKAITQFQESFKTGNIEQIKIALDKLIENAKKFNDEGKQKEYLGYIEQLKTVFSDLSKIDGLQKANNDLKDFNSQLESLGTKQLEELLNSFSQGKINVQNFVNAVREYSGVTAEAAKETFELGSEIDHFKNRAAYFLGLTNSINLFKRALQKALETVKELDAVMTETAVVTDFTVGDMWEKLPEYAVHAKALGSSIKDVYAATTLYYQQGLKTNEAMGVGVETMKMARIANLEAGDATQYMTAALRGFNMEVNELNAQRVNDVYSELAAITAADTSQIATAMSKTASIASAANMEFETTAALLAQIIETTQEAPETAGTALKTIIARFSEVKKLREEGQMTGEDEEGEAIDVNKIQAALRTVGISMDEFFQGTEGLDSILLKLAEKWNTLDFETQRYIATTAAGSRQQSRFIAMMSDYERTMELATAANNSAGASQQQFDKTLDSMEAKLAKLTTAWQEFTMGLANNEILKGAVDALTFVLNAINKLIDVLSGNNGLTKSIITLNLAIAAIGGLRTVLNKLLGSNLIGTIQKTFKTIEIQSKNTGLAAGENIAVGLEKELNEFADNAGAIGTRLGYNIASSANAAISTELNKTPQETGVSQTNKGNITKVPVVKKNSGEQVKSKPVVQTDNSQSSSVTPTPVIEQSTKAQTAWSKAMADTSIKGWQLTGILTSLTGTVLNWTGAAVSSKDETNAFGVGLKAAGVAASVAGNGLSLLAPILNTLKISIGSVLPWMTVAVAAIGAIIGVVQAIKNSSPEGQLNAAKKSAEQAAQAADEASEAYNELAQSLDTIKQKEGSLDELVIGTLEWKNAVSELNNEILDLIAIYPELGKFVTSENGKLKLSEDVIDGDSVESILSSYQQAEINAQSANVASLINVQKKQQVVDFENLDDAYKIVIKPEFDVQKIDYSGVSATWLEQHQMDYYSPAPEQEQAPVYNQEETIELAKAIASGKWEGREQQIEELGGVNSEAFEALREFGQSLIASEAAINAYSQSILNNASINSDLNEEQKKQLQGMIDSEGILKLIENEEDELSKLDTNILKSQFAEAMNYVYDEASGKIYSGYGEDRKEVNFTDEEIKEQLAAIKVQDQLTGNMTKLTSVLKTLKTSTSLMDKAFGRVVSKADGAALTLEDLNNVKIKESLEAGYEESIETDEATGEFKKFQDDQLQSLYDKVKHIYPPDEFFRIFSDAYGEASKRMDQATNKLSSIGLENSFKNTKIDTGAFYDLADNLYNVFIASGQKKTTELSSMLESIFGKIKDPEQAQIFADAINSINWKDVDSVKSLSDLLEGMGFNVPIGDIENLEDEIISAAKATKNFSLEEVRNELKSLGDLKKDLEGREDTDRTFTQDQRDAYVGMNADLAEDFVMAGPDEWVYIGDSLTSLEAAIRENTNAVLGENTEILQGKAETSQKWMDLMGSEETYDTSKISTRMVGSQKVTTTADFSGTMNEIVSGILAGEIKDVGIIREILGMLGEEIDGGLSVLVDRLSQSFNKNYGLNGSTANENIAQYQDWKNTEEQQKYIGMSGQELVDIVNTGTPEQIEMANKALAAQAKQLNITSEEIEYYKKLLAETGKVTGDLDAAATEMATRIRKQQIAINEASEKIGGYLTTMDKAEEGSHEYLAAILKIPDQIEKAFGFKPDMTWVQDNLDLIKQWAAGSEEAGTQIYNSLYNNIVAAMRGTEAEVSSAIQNMLSFLAQFDGASAWASVYLDDQGFMNTIARTSEAAHGLANYLETLKYDVHFEPVTKWLRVPKITYNSDGDEVGRIYTSADFEEYPVTTYNIKWKPTNQTGSGFDAPNNYTPPSGGGGGGGGGSSTEWKNPYDEFYNTVQKLNEELRKRNKLEKEYQKLLDKINTSANDLTENSKKQLESLEVEKKTREGLLENRKKQMEDIESENSEYSEYAWYNEELGVIEIDWGKIEELDGSTDEEFTQGLEDFIGQLEDQEKLIEEEVDALDDIYDETKKIREQGEEEYFSFEDRIKEALLDIRQDEIDKLNAINDSINDTNTRLINAMQSSVDKYRQDRDNKKTEEDLADKQRRLAYLQQDTSGANALEIMQLQKEIEEGQEDYTDTLIDQKISELQEQNDKAAEQRERQIQIMEEQLKHYEESGEIWNDVYALMNEGVDSLGNLIEGSELETLLKTSEGFLGMSELEKVKWLEDLENEVAEGFKWLRVGNSMKSLLDSGVLNKGQSVTFTTKDGKVVTGTLNDDGSVTTSDGKTYKNVYRSYDGTYKTTENYQTPEPPKQEPPKEETPVTEAPKLTEDIKKGVSAAIWNGGYGWGYDPEREERLKEVFGENDIQKNYVNKNVMSGYSGNLSDYSYSNMKKKFKQYKTGGLADFTGPAWLDGTKSKPEYILNADQTKAFFNLVDVLEGLSSGKVQNTQNTGDSIYDIDINVESIGNDYDVEQMASTIKRMINDDARYRNNNAINLQR